MNFLILENLSGKFVMTLITNFLGAIRPLGECQEGRFSRVSTFIPLGNEVEEIDGWTYRKYDPLKKRQNSMIWLDYESCTESKVSIRNSIFGVIIGLENLGENTSRKISEALYSAINEGIETAHVDIKQRVEKSFLSLLENSKRKEQK